MNNVTSNITTPIRIAIRFSISVTDNKVSPLTYDALLKFHNESFHY